MLSLFLFRFPPPAPGVAWTDSGRKTEKEQRQHRPLQILPCTVFPGIEPLLPQGRLAGDRRFRLFPDDPGLQVTYKIVNFLNERFRNLFDFVDKEFFIHGRQTRCGDTGTSPNISSLLLQTEKSTSYL